MSNPQAASVESSLPRYTAWKHLHDKAQWPGAVPDWAKDYSGRVNDGVAAQAVIEELRAEVTRLAEQGAADLAAMKERKDAAYEERNKVVAALAKLFPSGIAKTAIEGWSEDWHGCVYIDLPTGQVSRHFHDSQAHLFEGLPPYTKAWDGHDTPEKYRRLAALAAPQAVPGREAVYKWAYEYLQSRMESIGRHGWAHDCDGEIEARLADADQAARVSPAEKTVRMLTEGELEAACGRFHDPSKVRASIRKFCEVNAGCRIPADGKLGEGA